MPPMVVLVHGAFHASWAWDLLLEPLRQRGFAVRALDLPGHGRSPAPAGDLHDDAESVAEQTEALGQEVALVGHSYGGSVIAEASALLGAQVLHQVYVAAFLPVVGERPDAVMGRLTRDAAVPSRDLPEIVQFEPDSARAAFFHDCPPKVADWAVSRLEAQRVAPLSMAPRAVGWQRARSTYVSCSRDRVLAPAVQAYYASRAQTVRHLDCGHSPQLARPEALATFIHAAVGPAFSSLGVMGD